MTEGFFDWRLDCAKSWKVDAPTAEFAYVRTENNLTERVSQARKHGLSYGQYMAKLHTGEIPDPLKA